jgi:hypothetical protein
VQHGHDDGPALAEPRRDLAGETGERGLDLHLRDHDPRAVWQVTVPGGAVGVRKGRDKAAGTALPGVRRR